MPLCDSVNDTNTPNAYSGISLSTSASKTTSSTAAEAPSTTIPFENASRSPRNVN